MRPGRLCKNITVGPLPYEQANRVYQRLSSSNKLLDYQRFYTLAEIYNIANNIDGSGNRTNSTHQATRRVIGFSSSPREDAVLNKKSE